MSKPVAVPEHLTYLREPIISNILANDDNSPMANAARILAREVKFWRSQPLFTAPPAPAVPDGYCIMPLTLTAANGAKGALSGEFKVSRTVRCYECGGEGCDDCADAGEFEEEITVPWDTIKEIFRTAVGVCSMSRTQDAVDIFADQVIGTKTKIIRMPAPLNVPQEGIRVYLNADELFMQLEKQGYIVEVSNE